METFDGLILHQMFLEPNSIDSEVNSLRKTTRVKSNSIKDNCDSSAQEQVSINVSTQSHSLLNRMSHPSIPPMIDSPGSVPGQGFGMIFSPLPSTQSVGEHLCSSSIKLVYKKALQFPLNQLCFLSIVNKWHLHLHQLPRSLF